MLASDVWSGDVLEQRSESRVPDTPSVDRSSRGSVLRDNVRRKLLAEHGELRAVLVHADVRPAHAPFPVKGRAAVQHPVVVHDCSAR